MNDDIFNRMMRDVREHWHERALPEGEWIGVKEAAERLGLTKSGMNTIVYLGRIASVKHGSRRLVSAEAVEAERKRREERRRRGRSLNSRDVRDEGDESGSSDAPGEDVADYLLGGLPSIQSRRGGGEKRSGIQVDGVIWIDHDAKDVWAPANRACKLLNVRSNQLHDLACRGKLRRRWADVKTGQEAPAPYHPSRHETASDNSVSRPARRDVYPIGSVRAMFSLNEVESLANRRSNQGRNRLFSPNDPERPIWRGRISTKLEPPPGDAFVTRAEAAMMLKVLPTRITALVQQGTLFGWQAEPGKPGCPLYLSANQVNRLANNEEHILRRNRFFQGRARWSEPGKPKPSPRKADVEYCFEHGMSMDSAKALKRDHGEYYSTTQAADIFRVTRGTVLGMRRRGILKGYRSPYSRESFNRRRWWFFKKDDVHALKDKPERLRRRRTYLKRRFPRIYGDEAQRETYSQPGAIDPPPHSVDLSPSPAAKMKMEMEGW